MKPTNKKYCMVVYTGDERYGTAGHQLDFIQIIRQREF